MSWGELPAKHRRIMKARKEFKAIFGIDLTCFYRSVVTGFDVVEFDDWLQANVEKYPEGESMRDFILRKYGKKAVKLVEELI